MTASFQARVVRILAVLWPAFMVTIVLEGLVFSLFDPAAIRWTDSLGEPLSPLTVYSGGFLVIWALVSLAAGVARAFPAPAVSDKDSAKVLA
jgi:predicted metal-binding membrane protein